MITLDRARSLQAETATFWALMRDVAAADKRGDAKGRHEALDELSVFGMYAEAASIRARVAAEVERRGFRHNDGPDGRAADLLADLVSRMGGLPDNWTATVEPDGSVLIQGN